MHPIPNYTDSWVVKLQVLFPFCLYVFSNFKKWTYRLCNIFEAKVNKDRLIGLNGI